MSALSTKVDTDIIWSKDGAYVKLSSNEAEHILAQYKDWKKDPEWKEIYETCFMCKDTLKKLRKASKFFQDCEKRRQ